VDVPYIRFYQNVSKGPKAVCKIHICP